MRFKHLLLTVALGAGLFAPAWAHGEDNKALVRRWYDEVWNKNNVGTTTMAKQFDLHFEGSSSLAPLRAFSKSVDVLKGNVAFVVALTGPWERPGINGGLDITSGTLGLKSIPQRSRRSTAYIYLDEDKIVIERASGRFSGGDVTFKGTANLENFNIRGFYIESRFSDITASLSKDFWISLDGNLVFQGKGETQTIIGDVAVKRARYTERIDWKSLIFKARAPEKVQREMTKLDATQLSVKVTGSNLLIDNNLARVNVSADGLVRGTIGRRMARRRLR